MKIGYAKKIELSATVQTLTGNGKAGMIAAPLQNSPDDTKLIVSQLWVKYKPKGAKPHPDLLQWYG